MVDDREGPGRLSDLPTNLFKSLALVFSISLPNSSQIPAIKIASVCISRSTFDYHLTHVAWNPQKNGGVRAGKYRKYQPIAGDKDMIWEV